MEDNFYTKDFNYYQLVCWQDYIKMNGLAILKELWKIEQIYHRFQGKERFLKAYVIKVSDATLASQQGINVRTVKGIIEKLEKYGLIKILSDRNDPSEVHKNRATEYLIVKPIPLPPVVRINEDYIQWFGKPVYVREIEFMKELLDEEKLHLSLQNDTPKNEIMYEKGEEKLHPKQKKKKKTNNNPSCNSSVKENSNPDNVVVLDLKVNKIISDLNQVNAFKQHDITKIVLKLMKKYPIKDLEYIANYYLQVGCNSNVRNLYPYLEYAIKHKDEYIVSKQPQEAMKQKTSDILNLIELFNNSK